MIPVVTAGQNMLLTTEIIENDIPLLLSKDTMKKANTYIDFANDKIILNKEVHYLRSLLYSNRKNSR